MLLVPCASIPNLNRLNEWPLQFLRTGHYHRSNGYPINRTVAGYWWSDTASSATDGRYLGTDTWASVVNAQGSDFRGNGLALRCGVLGLVWFLRE